MDIRRKTWLLLVIALVTALMGACGTNAPEEALPSGDELQSEPTSTDASEPVEEEDGLVSRRIVASEAVEEEEVPEDAKVAQIGSDVATDDPLSKNGAYDPVDPYRPWYDLGSCTQMEGDILFLCVFVEDGYSDWTESEMETFVAQKCYPGIEWLVQQAGYWEVELNCTVAHFTNPVYCPGVYGDSSTGVNFNLLLDAATAFGYGSQEEMEQDMIARYGVDQVAFIVVMDKPGRCYAVVDGSNDTYRRMEYAVLFDDTAYYDGYSYSCYASTVAHELLHLFGAEDFYTDGADRVGRAALAEEWFPNDVMLRTYEYAGYNVVGPVTAYAVGWRDISHVTLTYPEWWE